MKRQRENLSINLEDNLFDLIDQDQIDQLDNFIKTHNPDLNSFEIDPYSFAFHMGRLAIFKKLVNYQYPKLYSLEVFIEDAKTWISDKWDPAGKNSVTNWEFLVGLLEMRIEELKKQNTNTQNNKDLLLHQVKLLS